MALKSRLGLFALAMALSQGHAFAQDDSFSFKTPSNNIYCWYDSLEGMPEVRCDIMSFKSTLGPRPADCDLDWGDAFAVTAQSTRGVAVCHGDTVKTPEAQSLPYGATWERKGISCSSEKTGLTCRNPAGHGFMLSKAKQKIF